MQHERSAQDLKKLITMSVTRFKSTFIPLAEQRMQQREGGGSGSRRRAGRRVGGGDGAGVDPAAALSSTDANALAAL